jgi:hypothetical protein
VNRATTWLLVLVGGCVLATAVDLGLRVRDAGVDHSIGVYMMLAELARQGCIYPAQQTTDLVYCTLYQPLGFLPYALLPGDGIELIPSIRVLVRVEVLLALAGAWWLIRRGGGSLSAAGLATVCLLAALPVSAASLTAIDDPRGAVLAMSAYAVFAGGQRLRPFVAAPLFALAFFTKLTAPGAAGIAALVAAVGARQARAGVVLLVLCTLWTALGYGIAHGVLQWDLAGNGLRYALFDSKPGRDGLAHVQTFVRGVFCDPVTAVLLVGGSVAAIVRLWRRSLDVVAAWLLAALVRAFFEYSSHGTGINHLFEPTLLGAVSLARALSTRLRPWHILLVLPSAFSFGHPSLLRPHGPDLEQMPLRTAALVLAAQPRVPTLCEDPLLTLLSGSRPIVTDAFLISRVWARQPEIRAAWFAAKDDPRALQRLVLLANPALPGGQAEHWYRYLHFDAEFLADARRLFEVVAPSDFGTVLERR